MLLNKLIKTSGLWSVYDWCLNTRILNISWMLFFPPKVKHIQHLKQLHNYHNFLYLNTGYVLDGYPSLVEDHMTIKDQLELVKNWKLKPDFIVNMKVCIIFMFFYV